MQAARSIVIYTLVIGSVLEESESSSPFLPNRYVPCLIKEILFSPISFKALQFSKNEETISERNCVLCLNETHNSRWNYSNSNGMSRKAFKIGQRSKLPSSRVGLLRAWQNDMFHTHSTQIICNTTADGFMLPTASLDQWLEQTKNTG